MRAAAILLTLAALPPVAVRAQPPMCPSLEILAVVAPDTPDSRKIGLGAGALWVLRTPLVVTRDIRSARTADEAEPPVLLDFTPQGSEHLVAYTTAHAVSRIAVLVDGEVEVTAKITQPMGAEGMQFTGRTLAEAKSLVDAINRCVKP